MSIICTNYQVTMKNIISTNLCKFLIISFFILFISLFFNKAHATCIPVGTTTTTHTYNATNLDSLAKITFTGTITCTEGSSSKKVEKYMCMKTIFTGTTTANSSTSLPYTVIASVGGAGSNSTNQTSNTWYGPVTTVANNNVIDYSVTVTVPKRSSSTNIYPVGTYTAAVNLYWDMQRGSANQCEGTSSSTGSGWDSGGTTLTANYVVPKICQLNSTDVINFGSISDIGSTKNNYNASGAISTTCNNATNYTIYLGNGNNYSSSRRMKHSTATEYIPYQLYKDSNFSNLWSETGGTTSTGGSGGLSLTGIGSAQSSTVYGKIASGITIGSTPGDYTDSVIVTVTY